MAQTAQQWEQELMQTGRVEIGLSKGKAVFTVLISLFIFALGLWALIWPFTLDSLDSWRHYILPAAGVVMLLAVPLTLSQLFGYWNLVVTTYGVGYREVQIPWVEVQVVGEMSQGSGASKQRHVAIYLTDHGDARFRAEAGAPRKLLYSMNRSLVKVPALYPGKMLAGSREEKLHWLASVHARALGYPG